MSPYRTQERRPLPEHRFERVVRCPDWVVLLMMAWAALLVIFVGL